MLISTVRSLPWASFALHSDIVIASSHHRHHLSRHQPATSTLETSRFISLTDSFLLAQTQDQNHIISHPKCLARACYHLLVDPILPPSLPRDNHLTRPFHASRRHPLMPVAPRLPPKGRFSQLPRYLGRRKMGWAQGYGTCWKGQSTPCLASRWKCWNWAMSHSWKVYSRPSGNLMDIDHMEKRRVSGGRIGVYRVLIVSSSPA